MGAGGRGQLHHSIVTSPVDQASEACLNTHPAAENGPARRDRERPVPTRLCELRQVP